MIRLALCFTIALVAGCQSLATTTEVPAVISDRTPRAQQELRTAISARLPGETLIAEDIFAEKPLALFEMGFNKRQLTPQTLVPPVKIMLIKRGPTCLLRFPDQHETTLKHVRCKPAPAS